MLSQVQQCAYVFVPHDHLSMRIGTRLSQYYTIIIEKLCQWFVFTTHIYLQGFDIFFKEILNKLFELQKYRRYCRFVLEWKNSCIPGEIINKTNILSIPFSREKRWRSHASEWTSSKGLLVFVGDEWKSNLCPFPYWQAEQKLLTAFLLICDLLHFLSIWWSIRWEGCPSLLCQVFKSIDWTFKAKQLSEEHWCLKDNLGLFYSRLLKDECNWSKEEFNFLFIWVVVFIPYGLLTGAPFVVVELGPWSWYSPLLILP